MDPNLQNVSVEPIEVGQDEFGITEEEAKSYKLKGILSKLGLFWQKIEPFVIKVFNIVIYNTLKFIKNFVTSIIHMAMGKEI